MSHKLPHHYTATLTWGGVGAGHAAAGARPLLPVGPPPEFGGDALHWSPEHLLLSALNACLMATFGAMAQAEGLDVHAYGSTAHAILDRGANGIGFTHFRLQVTISGCAGEEERLRSAMMRAKQRCFVANALRLPVEVEVNVVPGQGKAARSAIPAHA